MLFSWFAHLKIPVPIADILVTARYGTIADGVFDMNGNNPQCRRLILLAEGFRCFHRRVVLIASNIMKRGDKRKMEN